MARGQPALFHGRTCECRKSNNVASRIKVSNFSLKELIHFQPAAQIGG
jgi:hypothetical protein